MKYPNNVSRHDENWNISLRISLYQVVIWIDRLILFLGNQNLIHDP